MDSQPPRWHEWKKPPFPSLAAKALYSSIYCCWKGAITPLTCWEEHLSVYWKHSLRSTEQPNASVRLSGSRIRIISVSVKGSVKGTGSGNGRSSGISGHAYALPG